MSNMTYNILNPFDKREYIFPACPRCRTLVNSIHFFDCILCNTLKLSDYADHWSHIKCHNCKSPSANGYYCNNKNKKDMQHHGIYSESNIPLYKDSYDKYYCQDCYCRIFIGT